MSSSPGSKGDAAGAPRSVVGGEAAQSAAQSIDRFALRLSEMGRLWRSYHERVLKPLGISLIQWHVLTCLQDRDEAVVQRRLALAVGVDEPVLVGVLDRLESAGLVVRKAAAHDRRAKTVHLTASAGATLTAADRALNRVRRELLSGFSAGELARNAEIFETIRDRLWVLSTKAKACD